MNELREKKKTLATEQERQKKETEKIRKGLKNLQTAVSNVEVIPYIPSSHHFYKLEFVDSIYIVSISISHPNTSSNRIEMDPSLQNSLTE